MNRRDFTLGATLSALAALSGCRREGDPDTMYGIIGKMIANEGQRDELIGILLDDTKAMPGCLSYVISKDVTDDNALWITEVWETQESHQASLSLEPVQQAIAKGRPLIAGFGERYETLPVGGHGIG